ncbi:MAG TPA: HEPN domain-containing protein [Methanosarcinales archaeon]|nr:HEPN domain-containing protein [Methanosarcinales archaeon]
MKEITDFMKKAEKFLKTAELALDSGDYDSCVSRCYYAMFSWRKHRFLQSPCEHPRIRE